MACFPFRTYKGERKLKSHCKTCQSKLYKEWYANNSEYAKAESKKYVEKKKDEISEKRKKYYQDNIGDIRIRDKNNYAKNKDKVLARKKEQYWADPELSRKKAMEKYYDNAERLRQLARRYGKLPSCRERDARRRWIKKKCLVNLSEDQISQMLDIYWHARDITVCTGEPYEVDHIIPLNGVTICGLHVPWNLQILPGDLNRSKNNRYKEDDAFAFCFK